MRRVRSPLSRRLLATVLLTLAQAIARAGESDEEALTRAPNRPALRASALSSGFTLDGRLGDPAWRAATDSIGNLTTIEPEEGGVPAGQTIVKVLADPHAIVIGVQCRDQEPGKIVAFSKARDSQLAEEDHIVIVIDPFLDGRSGYVFAVNAAGARFDGLVAARGEETNSDWDTVWEAKTTRDERGWC